MSIKTILYVQPCYTAHYQKHIITIIDFSCHKKLIKINFGLYEIFKRGDMIFPVPPFRFDDIRYQIPRNAHYALVKQSI
jgi:hypothetical protein